MYLSKDHCMHENQCDYVDCSPESFCVIVVDDLNETNTDCRLNEKFTDQFSYKSLCLTSSIPYLPRMIPSY